LAGGMRLDELDYQLPPELIAQRPVERRDHSRLLVVDRRSGSIEDRHFYDLPGYVRPGDVLVINDTRVIPAGLTLVRPSGSHLDALFIRELEPGRWELMIRGIRKVRTGEQLRIDRTDAALGIIDRLTDKTCLVEVDPPVDAVRFLERFGDVPLPPYINRSSEERDLREADRQWYQTVFSKAPGAIAAPTAGLHFTEELLARLRSGGAEIATVTLHVGRGTFEPVTTDQLTEHKMHGEAFSVSAEAADRINSARSAGGRIIAVGTTSVRVLESVQDQGQVRAGQGWTELFICPPYRFKMVDCLITNFHLPRTTLLALVYAFAGIDLARRAYQHAIDRRYRFYSYGDAMLIL